MGKGQRSNKEVKKPKQPKKPAIPAGGFGSTPVRGGGSPGKKG